MLLAPISFLRKATGGPATPYDLWTFDFGTSGTDNFEGTAYALGTRFRSSSAGTVTKVRWYRHPFAGSHTSKAWRIYRHSDSTVLASGTIDVPNNSDTAGWAEHTLSSPLTISASTDYVVVVDNNASNTYYSTGGPFYNSGPVAGEGPLTNVEGYYSTTQGTMPTNTFNNEGYGVGAIVEA